LNAAQQLFRDVFEKAAEYSSFRVSDAEGRRKVDNFRTRGSQAGGCRDLLLFETVGIEGALQVPLLLSSQSDVCTIRHLNHRVAK
jgi:hypothetical protein